MRWTKRNNEENEMSAGGTWNLLVESMEVSVNKKGFFASLQFTNTASQIYELSQIHTEFCASMVHRIHAPFAQNSLPAVRHRILPAVWHSFLPAIGDLFLRYRVCIQGNGCEHTGLTTLYLTIFHKRTLV